VLGFVVIVAVAQCQPESLVQVVAEHITPILSWNCLHTLYTPHCIAVKSSVPQGMIVCVDIKRLVGV
jgi:hypothetical protein